jgi:hypothetical protein
MDSATMLQVVIERMQDLGVLVDWIFGELERQCLRSTRIGSVQSNVRCNFTTLGAARNSG